MRGRYAFWVAPAATASILILALALAGWLALYLAHSTRALIDQNAQRQAHEITAVIDHEIAGTKSVLAALAASRFLQDRNLDDFHAHAISVARSLALQIILYESQSGRQLINTALTRDASLAGGMTVPPELREQMLAATDSFVTNVMFAPLVGRHNVAVVMPVHLGDRLEYFLLVAIPADEFAKTLSRAHLADDLAAAVIDRMGNLIAGSPTHVGVVGEPVPFAVVEASELQGVFQANDPRGILFRWHYIRSQPTGWMVVVGLPISLYRRPVHIAVAGVLIFGCLAALAVGVGGSAARRRFARVVGDLNDVAKNLPHFAAEPASVVRDQEAQELSTTLVGACQRCEAERQFAVDAADVGTWSWELPTGRVYWSERMRRLMGAPATFVPRPQGRLDFVYPADREFVTETIERCLAGQNHYDVEYRVGGRDGRPLRWVNARGRVERDDIGAPIRVHGVIQDITARKDAEREHAELRRRLMQAQEAERSRLAHELHDETGQALTAALLELKNLEGFVTEAGDVRLQRLRSQMEEMGRTLRHVARELRPGAIEDLGLRAALANHISDWSEQYGIETDFLCDDSCLDGLADEVRTTIYRIVQEALTNVAKHAADATIVSVIISCREELLQLTIEDNGPGFNPSEPPQGRPQGLGLAGMRERLSLIGGTIDIESTTGVGTTLFVRIPRKEHEAQR